MNNFEKVNSSIQETIHKLDEKASFLFTATGIIFGLSALLVSPLISKTSLPQLIAIYSFVALYLITFIILVFLFSFTIFPRGKNVKKHPLPYNLYFLKIYIQKATILILICFCLQMLQSKHLLIK